MRIVYIFLNSENRSEIGTIMQRFKIVILF